MIDDLPASRSALMSFVETARQIHQMPSGFRWKMYAATFVLRAYATLLFASFALFEADTTGAFGVVVIIGIGVDVLRSLYAPEAKGTPRDYSLLPQRLHEGLVKVPSYRKIVWLNAAIVGGLAFYILGFMIFGPQTERDPVPAIVRASIPLEVLTAHISPLMRHIDGDLVEHGYPKRAMEAGHVFMAGVWLTIINVMMWFGGVWRNSFYESARRQFEDPNTGVDKAMLNVLFLFFLLSSSFLIMSNLITNDWSWSDPRYEYHIVGGNFSFYRYLILLVNLWLLPPFYQLFVSYYVYLCTKAYGTIPYAAAIRWSGSNG